MGKETDRLVKRKGRCGSGVQCVGGINLSAIKLYATSRKKSIKTRARKALSNSIRLLKIGTGQWHTDSGNMCSGMRLKWSSTIRRGTDLPEGEARKRNRLRNRWKR